MNEYNEGDLIEAVKGEIVIRGRLDYKLEVELTLALRSDVRHLIANGYTVTVIEKAPPKNPLPTEPGVYVTDVSDLAGSVVLYRLNTYGEWSVMWSIGAPEQRTEQAMIAGTSGEKLFRLELAHVTAKKVLGRVSEAVPIFPAYVASGMTKIIDMVGVEFGVGGNE